MNSVFIFWTCFVYALNERIESTAVFAGVSHHPLFSEVSDVVAVSDFFSIFLAWKYPFPPIDGFVVEFCDASSDAPHRCARKSISETESRLNITSPSSFEYTAVIDGLEMETRYKVRVNAQRDENDDEKRNRWIDVITKGFSARVIRCLDEFTEVEINTGPYFNGRVGVKGASDARCNLRGDPTSPRSRYLLLISHHLCDCQRFSQYVVSIVVVNQFPTVITKSSRRYKVVCDLFPDPFTVHAELNLTGGATQRDAAETQLDQLSERGYEDSLYRSREAVDFVPIIVVALLFVFVVIAIGMAFACASLRSWKNRVTTMSRSSISLIPTPTPSS